MYRCYSAKQRGRIETRKAMHKFGVETLKVPLNHENACCPTYPRSDGVKRCPVPPDKIPWTVDFPEYQPVLYTHPNVAKQPSWADPDFIKDPPVQPPKWNKLDGAADRRSKTGTYQIDPRTQVPLNPVGRTGVVGRGLLAKWGPNQAADPIVTRWRKKREENGSVGILGGREFHPDSLRPVLEFVAIQRRHTLEWAIPGGMVDPGEDVSETLMREFCEEAMNMNGDASHNASIASTASTNQNGTSSNHKETPSPSTNQNGTSSNHKETQSPLTNQNGTSSNHKEDSSANRAGDMWNRVAKFLNKQKTFKVYEGYVDDPRNTDNAWMETVVYNFHDEMDDFIANFQLHAGDDAIGVKWIPLDHTVKLYASHKDFCKLVVDYHDAHW